MDRLRCSCCREVIGVYEPMWVILGDGSERAGSRLSLAVELRDPKSVAGHRLCRRSETDREAQQHDRDLSSRRHKE